MRQRIVNHIDDVIFFPYALLIQIVCFRIIYIKLYIFAQHFQTGRIVCRKKVIYRTLIQDTKDGNDRDQLLFHLKEFCLQLMHISDKLFQGDHIGRCRQCHFPFSQRIRKILFLFCKTAEFFDQIFIGCLKLIFRKNRLYSRGIQYMNDTYPVISPDTDIHIHRRLAGESVIPGTE